MFYLRLIEGFSYRGSRYTSLKCYHTQPFHKHAVASDPWVLKSHLRVHAGHAHDVDPRQFITRVHVGPQGPQGPQGPR